MNKRTLLTFALAVALVAVLAGCASAQTAQTTPVQEPPSPAAPAQGKMPTIKAQNLNERELTLPQDLPGDKTLVLIAFERQQQTNVNTWIDGMKLIGSTYAWIETPVIEPKNGFMRAFIDGGMRSGIRDTTIREKTITLYTDRMAFLKSMGLRNSTQNIYVAVLDRKGAVLASVEGDYSAEKAALLLKELAP